MVNASIGQRGRLIVLIAYLGGLFGASRLALGTWIPPTSERGIWFYAALAALLLGSLLVTPFFTKPADAISYSVAGLVALLAANPFGTVAKGGFDRFTWLGALLYAVAIITSAVVAIAFKDSPRVFVQRTAQSGQLIADVGGSPRAIFSVIFLFALVTYHRGVAREYIVIGLAWALFVGFRPLETIANLWRRWRELWTTGDEIARLGEVVGHEAPGLVLVREDPGSSVAFGDVLLARTETGKPALAVALDHVGFASGRWLRAASLGAGSGLEGTLADPQVRRSVAGGSVFRFNQDSVDENTSTVAARARGQLVGLVASDTDVGHLQIEIVRADLDLQEGSLVEVQVGTRAVTYQVIKGLTKEEVLQEKNTRGFVRAQATKVGYWNRDRERFDPVPWLPQPNQPVFLVRPETAALTTAAIGRFPGTTYPLCIDADLLVTHNAAILGILGVGKSFLALELVERMISAGIKVVCLDLTNQYVGELGTYLDLTAEQAVIAALDAVGPPGKANVKKNVEEGGSIRQFSAKVKEQMEAFLGAGSLLKLRVLNPAQFEVWRQDSKPFQDQASMATLTPTEITRIITEAILEVLQAQGMTDRARCCLVYEEAHSLIPEWNAVASDGDRTATNGTAKAILQGRKFGLGCLVITQRTANVTKSILNQCNTVFGLRVFDATGMEFLKNYVGDDYAGVLSTLEERHAVVFGRASSCRDPVLTRLNDRADFIAAFREPKAAEA